MASAVRGSNGRRTGGHIAWLLLGIVLVGLPLPTLPAAAQEAGPVLARLPHDPGAFNTLELVRLDDEAEPPFPPGQTLHVWNASSSTAHEVRVTDVRTEPFSRLWTRIVLEYEPSLAWEPADSASHLCPRPGFDPSLARSLDRRGHSYQLASSDAFPEQSWRCARLTGDEVEELRGAAGLPDDGRIGFTKIVLGSGEALYQVANPSRPCRTVFLEGEIGDLAVVGEWSECNLEPFVDVDGDGIPEFLAPFSNSADAYLKRLWPTEATLASYSTGR